MYHYAKDKKKTNEGYQRKRRVDKLTDKKRSFLKLFLCGGPICSICSKSTLQTLKWLSLNDVINFITVNLEYMHSIILARVVFGHIWEPVKHLWNYKHMTSSYFSHFFWNSSSSLRMIRSMLNFGKTMKPW